MNFTERFIRRQLEFTKPLVDSTGLELSRSIQDKIGRLMRRKVRSLSVSHDVASGGVKMCLTVPRDEIRDGIIFYLHGGGYTCGGLEYAKGFASVLAAELGIRVLSHEYRLAPEFPHPAAVDDSVEAYKYILESGYCGENIILVGESAGGGLCYALCLRLRELGLPMPAGIVAISPWCDLTLSGASYESNEEKDPTLSKNRLAYFANCYVGNEKEDKKKKKRKRKKFLPDTAGEAFKNGEISPVFADLSGFPPSLIFVGSDEILLSDSEKLTSRLIECGSEAKLVVKDKMWHAYLLYGLKSQRGDFSQINAFLKHRLPNGSHRKLRWMSLDNAAKIYPAAASSRWTNVFRLSATLNEEVDKKILQSALDVTVRRFPSIAVRLRRGTFWYYLEEIKKAPDVLDEKSHPLSRMTFSDIRSCAFRVLVYKKRIAVEFFHALTDGNGALVFLKTLLAEYISEKYSLNIPSESGVLNRLEAPSEEELTDYFPIIAKGKIPKSRKDTDSYRIYGTDEPDSFLNNTTFIMDTKELLSKSRELGVSLTAYISAAFVKAAITLQDEEIVHAKNKKPVKVLIPCDLRRIYEGTERSMRNFALYATPGVDPRLGEYTHSEIAKIISHQMVLELTEKNLSSMAKANVKDEENMILKLTPLFIKNIVMKLVFNLVGERKSCFSVSNLGAVKLPSVMDEYIERFDFVLGVQAQAPYNTGLLSYKDITYLNIIRNIKEPRLEFALYRVLREIGIKVKVESNQRD